MDENTGDKTIELMQAWIWDCPDCGRENLYRERVVEDPDLADKIREYMADNGLIDHEAASEGHAIQGIPDVLACRGCHEKFRVVGTWSSTRDHDGGFQDWMDQEDGDAS